MSTADAVLNRLASGSVFRPSLLAGAAERYRPNRVPATGGVYPGQPVEKGWDSNRAVKEGLKVCSTLATCFTRISEKAATVPWYEWESKKSGSPKRTGIVPFLEYPRRDGFVSRVDLMEEAHLHAYLSGNALFGILWEGGSRRLVPREIQVENPHGCTPIPHRDRYISAYEWSDAALAGKRRWDSRDIIHVIGWKDPANRYWGWAIMEALAATIDADVEARQLNLRRFKSNGTPGTIIIDEDVTDDLDRQEKEDNLNRNPHRRFGAYMVLGGNQRVQNQTPLTTRQLGILDAMAAHRDEIAVTCGFLPAMFDPRAATYDNVDHAIKHEWRLVVLRNKRFSDAFTKRLIRVEERGQRWYAPDYSDVEELQDIQRKIDDTAKLVTDCRVAVNDAIEATGLPVKPQVGGEVPLVPANLVSAADAAQPLG